MQISRISAVWTGSSGNLGFKEVKRGEEEVGEQVGGESASKHGLKGAKEAKTKQKETKMENKDILVELHPSLSLLPQSCGHKYISFTHCTDSSPNELFSSRLNAA